MNERWNDGVGVNGKLFMCSKRNGKINYFYTIFIESNSHILFNLFAKEISSTAIQLQPVAVAESTVVRNSGVTKGMQG